MRNQSTHYGEPRYARRVAICAQCGRLFHASAQRAGRVCSFACHLASLPPPSVRFWSKVSIGEPDACWLWTAAISREGYGTFKLSGSRPMRTVNAHRYAYFLTHGRWPLVARHTCDIRACCNPAHILDGTYADNAADTIARGRYRNGSSPGERNGNASLTDAEALAIIGSDESVRVLADRYGRRYDFIWRIKRGLSWKHLPGIRTGAARLTEHQVAEIRARYRPGRGGANTVVLGRQFGVAPSTIWRIVRGHHVD